MRQIIFLLCIPMMVLACKGKNQAFDVTESDAFTGPTQEQQATQSRTSQNNNIQSSSIPTTKQLEEQANTRKRQPQGNEQRLASADMRGQVENKFWDNRKIYFFDQVGGMGDKVYEAIKGTPYFTNTVILVYTTDAVMEGTSEYQRIEDTMASTRLDDRIFIWVHFDENKEVDFVRMLHSDNLKNLDTSEANYRISAL